MSNQTKLLLQLASKIKTKPKSKNEIVASLHAAKILTKNGNFTAHYSNLKKVVTNH